MSYTKTNWVTGDVVTAEKMNKIENRIDKGMMMIIHVDEDPQTLLPTLDVTWQEIYDAVSSGVLVLLLEEIVTEEDVDGTIFVERHLTLNPVTDVTLTYSSNYEEIVATYGVQITSSQHGTFETHDPNGRPVNESGPK